MPVSLGVVSQVVPVLQGLLAGTSAKASGTHLATATTAYSAWRKSQERLANPEHDGGLAGRARSVLDNRDHLIRPEALAAAIDRHAADDAVFTTDTGMSTVWLSRFVTMTGTRRLIGSYNLGSMANAMPQALGIQAEDRTRQVIAFCGDGGLTMLLGDLLTPVPYELPVKLVVFNNGRLGMVKLEQEQGGLPEFGTHLANPDLAGIATAAGLLGIRVTESKDLDAAVSRFLAHPGPAVLDVVTNPQEIALPPMPTVGQAWGFAIAKIKETLTSAD
jgi:pyruvate dehydrogenase (quinone)